MKNSANLRGGGFFFTHTVYKHTYTIDITIHISRDCLSELRRTAVDIINTFICTYILTDA